LDELPELFMEKQSFPLSKGSSLESLYDKFKSEFSPKIISEKDGLWMYIDDSWIHIRPSNTEPIFRVIIETKSKNDLSLTLKRVKTCVES
jgi:phosphomannomutase